MDRTGRRIAFAYDGNRESVATIIGAQIRELTLDHTQPIQARAGLSSTAAQ